MSSVAFRTDLDCQNVIYTFEGKQNISFTHLWSICILNLLLSLFVLFLEHVLFSGTVHFKLFGTLCVFLFPLYIFVPPTYERMRLVSIYAQCPKLCFHEMGNCRNVYASQIPNLFVYNEPNMLDMKFKEALGSNNIRNVIVTSSD